MVGIYKITNPKNKIYIGQSLHIEVRFRDYKRLDCKNQIRLFNSLKKHGVEKHKFEIITECTIDEMNDLERYYQDLYSANGRNGLNCILTKTKDRSGCHSEETKAKLRKYKPTAYCIEMGRLASKKRKLTPERIANLHEGRKRAGYKPVSQYLRDLARAQESIMVINTETGIYYNSIKEAAKTLNVVPSVLAKKLSGYTKKNNTAFIYAQ
ncbi:MAG: GIY-YIG nuclease family protein [Bacteroidia bacterium]|nr:GIY-YIG nuclease family protein [Bacteroidia bacterium]